MKFNQRVFPGRQRGVALLMGMMMLLVLTLISVSSMQGSTMQEKMSGNVRETALAFQTAEDIVRQAETRLAEGAITGTFAGIVAIPLGDLGTPLYDCAGVRLMTDQNATTWPQPADVHTDRGENRYQVIQMTDVGGRGAPCAIPRQLETQGASRSNTFLVYGYSEGPAGRAKDIVVTTFHYNSD
ncbi:MAG: PilX N-terminal domain-containing pilus assembly protein [Lysobacterales bacterium]